MKPTRLDTYERVIKLILACGLAISEAAFWGGRPSTYTFIGTVLFGSEVARRLKKPNNDDS
jgi:hypothetical protein